MQPPRHFLALKGTIPEIRNIGLISKLTNQSKSSKSNAFSLFGLAIFLLTGWVVATCLGSARTCTTGAAFERLGPPGGTVRSLLIDSKNSKICYLGTSDGQIFKSQDSGLSWSLLYPGLKRRQLVIDTLVQDPLNPDRLFAGGWDLRSSGGGLFESADGGQSWQKVGLPEENVAVRSLAISGKHPAYMIAGTGNGVFVTENGGRTWQRRGTRMQAFLQAESVAIDPEDPRYLFVGTWHLGFRSSDFGKTWVQNDKGMISDSDVFSIAIDSRNPKIVFASACTGLYRSIDHGASWTRLRVFPQSYLVRAQVVYIDPSRSTRIYGGTTEGLFVSQDSGRSWKRTTPADWNIHAVQADPADSDVIMLGTESRGVLRSTDGGRSWAASNAGFVSRSITGIIPDPKVPGRFLVGDFSEGRTGGLHIYDNPVNGWIEVDPAEVPGEGLLTLITLPGDQGQLAGTGKGVFLRRPGSDRWTGLAGEISKLTVYDLALDKEKSWVFAGTNEGVYRARPEDLLFEKPSHASILPRVFSLLPSRSIAGRIISGTHMGVLLSEDSGVTWRFSSLGIPDYTLVECLIASPADENELLAGTSSGLYESKNGGRTWARMRDGRLGADIPSAIYLDSAGQRILAADNTSGGVFLSEDDGAHWDKLESPEFSAPVRILVQDPARPSTIYLGTGTEGVYRLSMPVR